MTKKNYSILSTRPMGDVILAKAGAQGVEVDIVSFIETIPNITTSINKEIDTVSSQKIVAIFTSMNAVEAVANCLSGRVPNWDIFCMGNTTRLLVQQHFGQKIIAGNAANAIEMANSIIEYDRERKIQKAVFFCGNLRREELPKMLLENNIPCQEMVVYNTLAMPHKIEKNYDGILFFSPSAVHSFFSSNKVAGQTVLFAIGHTTAAAIQACSNNEIVVGFNPSKTALLEMALQTFNKGEV